MNPTARNGVIGIAVVLMVVLVGQNFQSLPFLSGGNVYQARFTDTGGLAVGDRVQISGVRVGTVENLEVDGDAVRVVFDAGDLELARNTTLEIKTQTLLGRKYLAVIPGNGDSMRRGDVIPLSQTTSPYLLTDSLENFTTTVSGLDTRAMTEALDTLGSTLDAAAPNLGAALDGLSRFSASIGSRDELVRSMLDRAAMVSQVLADRHEQMYRMVTDGSALFAVLAARRDAIDTVLGNVTALTVQVKALIEENDQQLGPVLDQLNTTLSILDNRKEDVQRALLPLGQYVTSLGEAVAGGPFFKAYVMNLLPGQFLQPFIDRAFRDKGLDPESLVPGNTSFPTLCGYNSLPGTVPPGGTDPLPDPGDCPHDSPENTRSEPGR
ncbi:MCE family protein [Rhodococcus sp. 27YEA15]|uniref:MCE family protein n=1 Tax=Rhodococcus sp. 27YEA15 TaxID=3156259 RepID=UPI003C7C3834